ncbi:MAG: hypothetical protein IPH31_24555 [Lewinellaceae bacterium]|nr:hypothetical protein [Lewinellaceae bacterium]
MGKNVSHNDTTTQRFDSQKIWNIPALSKTILFWCLSYLYHRNFLNFAHFNPAFAAASVKTLAGEKATAGKKSSQL